MLQRIFSVKVTADVYRKIGNATAGKIVVREKMKKIVLILAVKLISFNVITTGGTKLLAFLLINDATTSRIVMTDRTKRIARLISNANRPMTSIVQIIDNVSRKAKFATGFTTAGIYLMNEIVEMSRHVIPTNFDVPMEASVSKCDGSVTVPKIAKTALTSHQIACMQNADLVISSVKTNAVSH